VSLLQVFCLFFSFFSWILVFVKTCCCLFTTIENVVKPSLIKICSLAGLADITVYVSDWPSIFSIAVDTVLPFMLLCSHVDGDIAIHA